MLYPSYNGNRETDKSTFSCNQDINTPSSLNTQHPATKLNHLSIPSPGEKGRPGEELIHLGGLQADLGEHPPPDDLLAGEGERQVDAVERHPVQLALPPAPAPPHRAVADRAHVLVVAEPAGGGGVGCGHVDRREHTFWE